MITRVGTGDSVPLGTLWGVTWKASPSLRDRRAACSPSPGPHIGQGLPRSAALLAGTSGLGVCPSGRWWFRRASCAAVAGQVPGLKGRGFCLGRGQVGADRFQSAGRGRSDQTVKWAGGQGRGERGVRYSVAYGRRAVSKTPGWWLT